MSKTHTGNSPLLVCLIFLQKIFVYLPSKP